MTQELLYTSAPAGLMPGSQGFTTVAATKGLSAVMRESLEGLCAYRPLFTVNDTRNPITHAHFKLMVSGQSHSVLARIGPAGTDYSGRQNKFAHLLILDSRDRASAGPAWLISESRLLNETWDGRVGWRENQPIIPKANASAAVCAAWERATGDAGWAGALVESFIQSPNRPAIILCNVDTDLLPLFDEAIRLLPASRRWDVSFSTYFANQSPNVECLWRGMIAGTADAKAAVKRADAFVVDLSRRLGPANGGRFIEAARTGVFRAEAQIGESESTPVIAARATSPRHKVRTRTPVDPLHEIDWPAPASAVKTKQSDGTVGRRSRWGVWLLLFALLAGGGTAATMRWISYSEEQKSVEQRKAERFQLFNVWANEKKLRLFSAIATSRRALKELADKVAAAKPKQNQEKPTTQPSADVSALPKTFSAPDHEKTPEIRDKSSDGGQGQVAAHPRHVEPTVFDLRPIYKRVERESFKQEPLLNVADLSKARLVYTSARAGVFAEKYSDDQRTVTLSRTQPRLIQGEQATETFEFVQFALLSDGVRCRLIERDSRKPSEQCWSDLFDSILAIHRGDEVISQIALRPICNGNLLQPTNLSNASYRLFGWLDLPPAKGELAVRKASLITEVSVTRRERTTTNGKTEERVTRPVVPVTFSGDLQWWDAKEIRLLPVGLQNGDSCDESIYVAVNDPVPNSLCFKNAAKQPIRPEAVQLLSLEVGQRIGTSLVPVFSKAESK